MRIDSVFATKYFFYNPLICLMTSNSEYLKKLGENLRIKRQEALLSQQELADISNVAKSTIQRIEKGTLNPSITNLKAICDALNITVQTLMSF